MRRIRFTTHITDDAPTTHAPIEHCVHCEAKAVARRHAAADHRSAIRAHYHAVIGPPRGGEIQRTGADMRFQLSRSTHMRKAERLRVDGPTSNKNGQATSGPAVLVESGVHVDHQALPQTAFLPFWRYFPHGEPTRISLEPNTMLRACPHANTTCGVSREAAVRSPSRGSRRRRVEARPWSCSGARIEERRPPSQPVICLAGSSREGLFFPRPLRSL